VSTLKSFTFTESNIHRRFSGKEVPCVGISFGVDRIFSITKKRMEAEQAMASVRRNEVDVYVMALGFGKEWQGLLKERMQVCSILWDAGIKAEFAYKLKPKLPAQFKLADDNGVPFAVIIGEEEQAQGKVKIKEMGLDSSHPEKDGVTVNLTDLVPEVKKRLVARAAKQASALNVEGPPASVVDVTDAAGNLEINKA
jgi:histidyl-tRNA synthetase